MGEGEMVEISKNDGGSGEGCGERERLPGAYGLTFFLTITNPVIIISFAAIFAGLGLVSSQGNYVLAGILVVGVFIGSTL